jgi:hypothetical protein
MAIKVFRNNAWMMANDAEQNAFHHFKDHENVGSQFTNEDGLKYIIRRKVPFTGPIYMELFSEDGEGETEKIPIINFDDINVFMMMEWRSARNYQQWCYADYLYSGKDVKHYMSAGTSNLSLENGLEYTVIFNGMPDSPQIPPNIVFSVLKNENGTVFYQRNYGERVKVRMSDCKQAMNHYIDNLRRRAAAGEPRFIAFKQKLCLPGDLVISSSTNDDDMCIVCNDTKKNIMFLPCGHDHTCSLCWPMLTNKEKCPYCKQQIINIVKL